MIPESTRTGGHLISHEVTVRNFLVEPLIHDHFANVFKETKVCSFHETSETISPWPTGGEGSITLDQVKYVVGGFMVGIRSREALYSDAPFHYMSWHRFGLPHIKNRIFGGSKPLPFSSGIIVPDILEFFDPLEKTSINIQGADITGKIKAQSTTLLNLMTRTEEADLDPNLTLIELTRHGLDTQYCAGMNLHQFSKSSLTYTLGTEKEIDLQALVKTSPPSIWVGSKSTNILVNTGNNSLYQKYFNCFIVICCQGCDHRKRNTVRCRSVTEYTPRHRDRILDCFLFYGGTAVENIVFSLKNAIGSDTVDEFFVPRGEILHIYVLIYVKSNVSCCRDLH